MCRLDRACPVDGGWTSWGAWQCSVTCGTGVTIRHRTCTQPTPSGGGDDCQGAGEDHGVCRLDRPCPVNGGWSSWGAWQCSVTCGTGVKIRRRTCTDPSPSGGGAACQGASEERGVCTPTRQCPVDGVWSSWGEYGACSVTCGAGNRKRSRTCSQPAPSDGGAPCQGQSESTTPCYLAPCPVAGYRKVCAAFYPIFIKKPETCS